MADNIQQMLADLQANRANIADIVSNLENQLTARWEEREGASTTDEEAKKPSAGKAAGGSSGSKKTADELPPSASSATGSPETVGKIKPKPAQQDSPPQRIGQVISIAEQVKKDRLNAKLQAQYLREATEHQAKCEILAERLKAEVEETNKLRQEREKRRQERDQLEGKLDTMRATLREQETNARNRYDVTVERVCKIFLELHPELSSVLRRIVLGHLVPLADDDKRFDQLERLFRKTVLEDGGEKEKNATTAKASSLSGTSPTQKSPDVVYENVSGMRKGAKPMSYSPPGRTGTSAGVFKSNKGAKGSTTTTSAMVPKAQAGATKGSKPPAKSPPVSSPPLAKSARPGSKAGATAVLQGSSASSQSPTREENDPSPDMRRRMPAMLGSRTYSPPSGAAKNGVSPVLFYSGASPDDEAFHPLGTSTEDLFADKVVDEHVEQEQEWHAPVFGGLNSVAAGNITSRSSSTSSLTKEIEEAKAKLSKYSVARSRVTTPIASVVPSSADPLNASRPIPPPADKLSSHSNAQDRDFLVDILGSSDEVSESMLRTYAAIKEQLREQFSSGIEDNEANEGFAFQHQF
ncbi:unnamed protein product [Amoebophrya sp. A120]|nr:unnamed protein product [Amoebophrya sp. A120]|eukprot:GSA120T00003726001.1